MILSVCTISEKITDTKTMHPVLWLIFGPNVQRWRSNVRAPVLTYSKTSICDMVSLYAANYKMGVVSLPRRLWFHRCLFVCLFVRSFSSNSSVVKAMDHPASLCSTPAGTLGVIVGGRKIIRPKLRRCAVRNPTTFKPFTTLDLDT